MNRTNHRLIIIGCLVASWITLVRAQDIEMAKDDKGGAVVYQRDSTTVYRAALAVAASQGVITFSDKDAGIISVNIGPAKYGRQPKLSIQVVVVDTPTDTPKQTRVHLTTQGGTFGFKGWSDGKMTRQYFQELNAQLTGPRK